MWYETAFPSQLRLRFPRQITAAVRKLPGPEDEETPSTEALGEWGVDLKDDNSRRILRRLASPERMTPDTLRRAAAALQPADPVLFAAVSAALGGALRREAV